MSLTPISRREQYYDAIANGSTDVPDPITREEQYLKAIAEKGSGGGGSSSADDVSYDNTSSGLTATNVQDAIDEVAQSGGGETWDIEISGTITENINPEALEALTYKINSDIDTLLAKVQTNGNLKIKSTAVMDLSIALTVVGISSDNYDPTYTTDVTTADGFVKQFGGSGTSKNCLVVGLYARSVSRWDVDGHSISMQGAKMLLYENSTEAEAGNHNVAYIISSAIPV